MATEIWCRKCNHSETLARPLRLDDACPACGAGIYRRAGRPTPASHLGDVIKSMLSLRGILFLLFVSGLGAVPDWRAKGVALIMLTFGALKLSFRAMRANKDGIEFPELSPEELFDGRAVIPAVVFTVLFLTVPAVLTTLAFAPNDADAAEEMFETFSERDERDDSRAMGKRARAHDDDDDDDGDWREWDDAPPDPALAAALAAQKPKPSELDDAASARAEDEGKGKGKGKLKKASSGFGAKGVGMLVLALLLVLYAPMALVMYLRTATTFGFFLLPQGLRAIFDDTRGYVGLCVIAVPALVGRGLLDLVADALPFFLDPIALLPRNVLVMIAWGACGLYVRSRARAFDLPVDDEDWVLHTRAPAAAPAAAPAPARPKHAPLSLGPDDDLPPAVTGTLLPPDDQR